MYDAPIRCWDDLSRYVDERRYIDESLQSRSMTAHLDEDEFVTAVQDRTDTLLHQHDRLLSFDEAEAAGFDGALRDSSEPHTWGQPHPAPAGHPALRSEHRSRSHRAAKPVSVHRGSHTWPAPTDATAPSRGGGWGGGPCPRV